MGRGQGEFFRLPLRKKGGAAFGGDYMGGVSRLAIQLASNPRRVALRDAVCGDRGSNSKYVQEIPVRNLVGINNLICWEDKNILQKRKTPDSSLVCTRRGIARGLPERLDSK